jgi:GNAT superfamily N-acetyltransferase
VTTLCVGRMVDEMVDPGPTSERLDLAGLTFREVTAERWDDLVELFDVPGWARQCWCMVWRAQGAEQRDTSRAARRQALERRVRAGTPVGILGYLGERPVAWCSIAPRETYRELGGPPAAEGEHVWSLVCMFAAKQLRGKGMMRRLIAAAVEHAAARGANVVEAYPVDPDSPSYQYMGLVPVFAAAGFEEVGRAGTRRHVMRLTVRRG